MFSTGFHAMPSGYLDGRPPVLGPTGLLKPLRVQLIGGTALIGADALRAAGGSADLSAWTTGYSDHLHLSAELMRADSPPSPAGKAAGDLLPVPGPPPQQRTTGVTRRCAPSRPTPTMPPSFRPFPPTCSAPENSAHSRTKQSG